MKALDHALCVQKEPGNNYSEEKTREWVRNSPVPMAEVVEGTIHFHSLACSHMAQGVRSIIAKVPNSSKRLGDGKNYDPDVIAQKNPKFANLIRNGIRWFVLMWQLEFLYPGLFELMSQARNVFQAIGRVSREVQGISDMIHGIKTQMDAGEVFNLARIKKAILRSRPWYGEYMNDYYCFVFAKGGGSEGIEWQRFVLKHTAFVTPSLRSMPVEMLGPWQIFPGCFWRTQSC